MNSTQIRCFLAVAKHKNISRAAEELFLSQPSVSRYLSQLEKEWGVPLFVRKSKGVELTEEGREYQRLCRRTEASFAALREKHQAARQGTASLSLEYAVFPVWNISKLLYENAQEICARHPQWKLSLKLCQTGELVEALLEGRVDCIFTVGSVLADREELETRPLLELPQAILFSRQDPRYQRPDLTPQDFAGEEFLFVTDEVLTEEMVRRQARAIEKRFGFSMRTRLLDSPDELSLALELGQGVALMDYWSRYRSNSGLRALVLDLALPVVLAWRRDGTTPELLTFAQETEAFFRRQGQAPDSATDSR